MRIDSDRLIDIRESKGLSQAELARRSKISAAYLCQIEAGDKPGTHEVIERVTAALGLRNPRTIAVDDGEFRPSRRDLKAQAEQVAS